MSSAGETEIVDVSEQGQRACDRVESSMAALDKAIDAREKQLEKSDDPKDKAILKSAEAHKAAYQSTLGLGQGQKNSQDHANPFLEVVARAAEYKLSGGTAGRSVHNEIDQHYDRKYSMPLEKKLQYARALKIGTVQVGGKKTPLGAMAHNTQEDIRLAKATASLVAEGHTKLEIPKTESKMSERQRGAEFASAIIKSAEEVRAGQQLRFAVKNEQERAVAPAASKLGAAARVRKEEEIAIAERNYNGGTATSGDKAALTVPRRAGAMTADPLAARLQIVTGGLNLGREADKQIVPAPVTVEPEKPNLEGQDGGLQAGQPTRRRGMTLADAQKFGFLPSLALTPGAPGTFRQAASLAAADAPQLNAG